MKKIILPLFGVTIIIFGFVMLRPLPFSDILAYDLEITVLIIPHLQQGEHGRLTYSEYIFQPDSEEFIQIRQILGEYSFRRCFRSFFTSSAGFPINESAGYSLHIRQNISHASIIFWGSSGIHVNSQLYRIGYFGNEKALAIMDKIRIIIEHELEIQNI